ncbi:MAG: SMC-Scp complex subunit ScpB [Bacillota bacterium]|nr:SMC-Scp complex subunit ScpB [Bacillota bacterium]
MKSVEIKEVEAIIESILFAAGNPVPLEQLAVVLEMDKKTLESILKNLSDKYDYERRGLKLIRLEDEYQLTTRPEYSEYVKKALDNRRESTLSPAAFEVLAVIAYNEPVTRGYVSSVRGIESGEIMDKLSEKGLIEECGKLDAPGRPRLFRTTTEFLRVFGLQNLDELPQLDPDEMPEVMEQTSYFDDEGDSVHND